MSAIIAYLLLCVIFLALLVPMVMRVSRWTGSDGRVNFISLMFVLFIEACFVFSVKAISTSATKDGQIQALTGKATIERGENERGEMVWTEKATTREGK